MPDINVVIEDSPWVQRDLEIIFDEGDAIVFVNSSVPIERFLADFNVYKSSSEARRAGKQGLFPKGYTEMKASKKVRLFIWNPSEGVDTD